MKNLLLASALLMVTTVASAKSVNLYNSLYLDCIDYGHSGVSAEKEASCRADAKEAVLDIPGVNSDYLDCIDYGHQPVSAEKDIQCLEDITVGL